MADRAPLQLFRDQRGKAAVIVILILLLVGGGIAAFFLLRGGGGSATVTRYIPAGAETVGGVDVESFLSSSIVNKAAGTNLKESIPWLPKGTQDLLKQSGLDLAKMQQVTFAASGIEAMQAGGMPQFVAVTQGAFDKEKLETTFKQTFNANPKEFAGLSALTSDKGGLAVPTNDVFVVGSGDLFGKALELSQGKGASIDDDENMAAARDLVDQGATFWAASKLTFPKGLSIPIPGLDKLTEATHSAMSVDLSSGVKAKGALLFKDAAGANGMKTGVDAALGAAKLWLLGAGDEMKPLKAIIGSLVVEVKGRALVASVTIAEAEALEMVGAVMQGM